MRAFLLSWALLTLAGVLQPSPPASFSVGVLRRDALIVPFATWDGSRWQNYWPLPANNADVPLSIRDVDKRWWGPIGPRDTWQVWTPGSEPQMVKVRQPDWAPSYCQKEVGLRTDYQPRLLPPPPVTSPYPKDGLAVSPPHPVEPIEVLAAGSRESGDVVEAIHARFVEQEHEALQSLIRAHGNNPRQVPLPPNDGELRATPSMVVEALYAYGTSPRTYFIETTREYRRDGACTVVLSGRGRVTRGSGKFTTDGFRLGITACDRSNASYMLPLGVISLPSGVYWIAQISGWDREAYTIIDITPRSEAKDQVTPGGGC
jgi:hypothetical protein